MFDDADTGLFSKAFERIKKATNPSGDTLVMSLKTVKGYSFYRSRYGNKGQNRLTSDDDRLAVLQ
jgi:hypothetical protein